MSFIGVRSDHFLAGDNNNPQKRSNDESQSDTNKSESRGQKTRTSRVLNIHVVNPITNATIPVIVSDHLPYSSDLLEYYLGYGSGSELDAGICSENNFNAVAVLENYSLVDYMDQTSIQEPVENVNSCASEGTSTPVSCDATLVNSGSLSGLGCQEARDAAVSLLQVRL